MGLCPVFRDDKDKIELNVETPRGTIRFSDNFVFIEVEATGPDEARYLSVALLDRYLQHLGVNQARLYTFVPLGLVGEDGGRVPLPRRLELGKFTTYDLASLRRDIEEAGSYVEFDDLTLVLAIDYYQQAQLLFSQRGLLADPFLRQHSMLISTAFLNLWKAISTIVGDPSVDSDYQSRYKNFEFDYDFFAQKIEKVRDLRNNYDVAHYSLDPTHLERVEESFGEAAVIANQVLRGYRQYLLENR